MKLVLDRCIIAHNTGLGDHIMMNGAARYLLNSYDQVYVVTYGQKVEHVKYMYRDDPRIHIVAETDAASGKHAQRKIRKIRARYEKEGFDARMFFWPYMRDWPDLVERIGLDVEKSCWCEAFYKAVGVDYKQRHESFYFKRDPHRERELYKRLGLPKEYAFVASKRAKKQSRIYLNTKLPIVSPDSFPLKTLVFDWMSVIENATEIHTVDTSWFHLIKSMKLDNPRFFHRYARPVPACGENYLNDGYDNGWTDIKEKMDSSS
tara:strand:- start:4981 stop:5766 length:786 start_codon:yes stop_codon:yes gene_type:complete